MKRKNLFNLLLLIVGLMIPSLLLVQCGKNQEENHGEAQARSEGEEAQAHEREESHSGEGVQLSNDELQEFGIELSTAGPGRLKRHVDLTGEIVIDPDCLAHIFPRFPGVVKTVNVKIGDPVKKNEALAVIESNESLAPYSVTSLIDGTVLAMHLTPGEVISDVDHKITIANLSHVWANLSVYQKDLAFIKLGSKVEISAGPGIKPAAGTISYISPVVDEKTRTAQARVVLSNSDGRWKPGLFVGARVIVGSDKVDILVPKTALQTFENNMVVFIKDEDGFEPRTVSIGRSNTESVEIVSGLHSGEKYVSRGGFTLKAELQKESFGEGHEH